MNNTDGSNLSPIGNYNKMLTKSLSISNDMLTGSISIDKFKLNGDKELLSDLNALGAAATDTKTKSIADNFAEALGNSIDNVNKLENEAHKAVETFATGGNIDVHSVMIATQKAKMSMAMATQVRNKAMEAYQSIWRMQV